MVVTNDIGNPGDIHPKNKQEVGRRLALWALAQPYGKNDTVHQGPTYKSMLTEGNRLIISFDNIGGGLKSRDAQPLSWFEIVDSEEGGFVKAKAEIEGGTVVLTAGCKASDSCAVRVEYARRTEPEQRGGVAEGRTLFGRVKYQSAMYWQCMCRRPNWPIRW